MKKMSVICVAGMLSVPIAGPVSALDGQALYNEPAKGGCSACHGKDAKTPILPTYPKLAGQNADYAFNQMKDIKSGARNNGQTAAMKGVMHLVNEDEMRAIANWLSSLK
jgi:cytochrome c